MREPCLAGPTGLEPAIFGLTGRYVIRLHHGPFRLSETNSILPHLLFLSNSRDLCTLVIVVNSSYHSRCSQKFGRRTAINECQI
jgi:hypothetical protein